MFSDADVADQVVMLRMIEELHRQKRAGPEYSRRGRWLAGGGALPRLGWRQAGSRNRLSRGAGTARTGLLRRAQHFKFSSGRVAAREPGCGEQVGRSRLGRGV